MKASVFTGPCKNEVMDRPIPKIGDNEVLIKVEVCGVCASELECWFNGDGGKTGIRGHEPVGIIEAMGKDVTGFSLGDRVTGLIGSAFAEYAKADVSKIVKVPDRLDPVEALGEPLSCLVSGAERTTIHIGDTVAVVGLGFMGMGFMQLMKIKGAGRIIAVDVRQDSLDSALKLGANKVYLPDKVEDIYKVTEWAHIGRGVDVAVDATGKQPGLDLAGNMTAVHGTLSIVGWHQGGLRNVNMELWNWKGITVINAHERREHVYMECMKSGLKMIDARLFNMKDMITHEFSLNEVDKAYNALKAKPEGFIKAIVRI